MSGSFAATVGNGRILARIGRDGSLMSLAAPQLDHELIQSRIHGVVQAVAGDRSLSGKSWKHKLDYLRGTNVLQVVSTHATAGTIERRLAAIDDSLRVAYRSADNVVVGWDGEIKGVLPQAGLRVEKWPEEFDPPPLAGATRASLVARIPDITDRAAVTELYARSILVIAHHHDRSGAFVASPGDDVVLAHALDACGERGASRAFFEWALKNERSDPQFAWAIERHMKRSRNAPLSRGPEGMTAEEFGQPHIGTAATLHGAWQDAVGGQRAEAVAALHKAVLKRSALGLFLSSGDVDLLAHAYLLLTVQALIPAVTGGDDGFFEHQATAQKTRHARALYGGAYHAGMPEAHEPALVAEVRPDLDVSSVTVEVAGRATEQFAPVPGKHGHPVRWKGPLPEAETGEVTRYKVRVHLGDRDTTPMWASDSDPRPGGQEFAFETDAPPPPEWVRDAICYQVMVDRFARPGETLPPPGDPTALYGGTLDGVREHLDHIVGLGCNVLWLSPVHASPSHHGYDHEDFLTVEPRYGGDAALIRLVEAAHDHGLRVLLDFVPNHTGRGHHLFRDAIAGGGDAASYYRFWQWPHY